MKRRIRLLGGGLAIVLLSACNSDVTEPEAVRQTVRPAAARVTNDQMDVFLGDSAVARKKGRYAMGAN
ncbi:MAG: hypothetical protein WEE89_04210 [Gemmatimonadota bacterium]